ncbi:MAG: carboxymuconolactone decarboxylase family protein [Firmicutes bacterium]|nr:carboxymuconolactone decarboxylase family protein [Bacillota bacterium]
MDKSRRLYTLFEGYMIMYQGIRTIRYVSLAKKNNELDQDFFERIMLAVTEVNGCPLCSYAHTRMALEAGLEDSEVKELLNGEFNNVPSEELKAILFAQHYAENRGKPSKKAWDKLVLKYGLTKALGILGSIRIIMIGNVYGIPLGSFMNRFGKTSDKRSNIIYELVMLVSFVIFMPIVIMHMLIAKLFKFNIISFSK